VITGRVRDELLSGGDLVEIGNEFGLSPDTRPTIARPVSRFPLCPISAKWVEVIAAASRKRSGFGPGKPLNNPKLPSQPKRVHAVSGGAPGAKEGLSLMFRDET
jgi:hypothetical protein